MRMKLHRGKRDVFRKRNPLPRILGWVLTAVVVIGGGFFGAKWLSEHPVTTPTPDEQVTVESTTTTTTTTQPTKPEVETLTEIRGFYLPFSALSVDTLTEVSLLSEAKEAGYNAVIFDMKDAEGRLYYRFEDPTAQKVNSYVDNALTADQLEALFDLFRENGLQPIPRLYAFQDNLGAKALADARITPTGNSGWVWYDGDPGNGGKAWLNPYDNDAHAYLGGLAEELKEMGAAAVMLDSVQFPRQTSAANFGSDNKTLKNDEALSLFVKKTRERLGEECPVILCSTAESALGSNTQVYGGNPLTFGADVASPLILPAKLPATIKVGENKLENTSDNLQTTVKELVAHMILRTKVMKDDAPAITPFLQVEGYKAKQVKAEIAGCREGGSNSYILYHPKGDYDFGAY